jgi:hypothetical protein
MSIAKALQDQIFASPTGWVFCANDFDDLGSRGNIDVVLHRLAKQGIIRRLGYGLYDNPQTSPLLGTLTPDIKDIMHAYSRRMGQTFVLDPLNAANALGLSTQVPAQLTYLTDGKTHTITICGIDIHFVHAAPKKIAGATTPVGLLIQALRYFGAKGTPDKLLTLMANHISKSDLKVLKDLKSRTLRNLAPQIDRILEIATVH